MIEIKSGVLTIPENERHLGVKGDNLSATKQFEVFNIDDKDASYELYLNFYGKKEITIALDKEIVSGSTKLYWKIKSEHLLSDGVVIAKIKACLSDGTLFSTTHDYFLVSPDCENILEDNSDLENNWSDNSFAENNYSKEFEEKLASICSDVEKISNDYVTKSRTISGLDLSADLTRADMQKALKTYPIILTTDAPTISTAGEIGQMLIVTTAFLKDIAPLYFCRNVSFDDETGKNIYTWQKAGGEEGLKSALINDIGELVFTFKDGSLVNLGVVVGKDGVSVTHSWNDTVLTVTSASGTNSVDLKGEKGEQGEQGIQGVQGEKGENGADGYTPVKGVDYFTDADKEEVVDMLIDETGLINEFSYNAVTNNLNDNIYEYGYLSSTGENQDTLSPITVSFRTKNYIPVEGGRVLCWNRNPAANSRYISLVQYNANKECIVDRAEQQCESNKWTNNGVTLNENTKYVRFTVYSTVEDLSAVQINLFYYENRADMWTGAGDTFNYVPHFYSEYIGDYVPKSKVASPLTGKKIIYDGDSICESRTSTSANNGGGFAKLIADKVGGKFVNYAVSGARLTTKPSNRTYHSVVDNLENLPTDGDLYCFEGGINDYWTPKQIGTYSKTDFTGTLDTNTVCGALEAIFRYALNNFVGKPIVFIITHKIQNTAYTENTNGDTFEDYRNAMVGICEKYSIPYYDAFSKSGLNGFNTVQNNAFLTSNTDGTPDGCHPNEEGYKRFYVPQLISLFESIMPT